MIKEKASASITIMVSLTLLIVMSLMFSLVELGRVEALASVSTMTAKRATDSAISQYIKVLWDEYGVLYFDGGYGTSAFSPANLEKQINLYGKDERGLNEVLYLTKAAAKLSGYNLATDNGGRDFIEQACTQIIKLQGTESAGTEKANMEQSKMAKNEHQSDSDSYFGSLSKMSQAEAERDKKIEEAKKAAKEAEANGEEPPEVPEVEESDEVKNFKEAAGKIGNIKKGGMTSLVLGSDAAISQKTMKSSSPVSSRSLNSGQGDVPTPRTDVPGALQDILFAQYLSEYYSSYVNLIETHAMTYELEYIVSGKDTDAANLEAAILKLVGLREVENLAALFADSGRRSEALALGAELATALWVPEFALLFGTLVMVAWAFTESIMDVRTLLSGGKIAIVKSPAEWSSDLMSIADILDSDTMAEESAAGITWQGYMNQLIYFMSTGTKAYRAMDMMEETLIADTLTSNARMDNMIARAKGEVTFTASPLFLQFVSVGGDDMGIYSFTRDFSFTYY